MEEGVRALLAELAAPWILAFLHWDTVIDNSRPFSLHCDASTDGLRATLKQKQPNGCISPIVYLNRAALTNELNWTPMELEDGPVVWSIRRLHRYLFSVFFLIYTDRECLYQISKMCKSKPRILRCMEFLSVYNYCLSDRRGRERANADFLSRLPLPPTVEDLSGSSALTDPDEPRSLIDTRTYSYIMPFFPIPGAGLSRLAPSPNPVTGTGSNGFSPLPTLVLCGLPLTKDGFRTHRFPIPTLHMPDHTTRPFAAPTEEPCLSHAINDQNDTSRFKCARCMQSQAVMLEGKTPLRPNYCRAARSGFASSAAPAPSSKVPVRSSPPPHSTRLGSTILLGFNDCPARCRPLPFCWTNHRPQLPLSCKPLLLRIMTPAPQLKTS